MFSVEALGWEQSSHRNPIIFRQPKGAGMVIFNLLCFAPASVQEMNDFVDLGFELAFKP
jgi:hypothetical protein